MKKLISLLLAALMLACCLPAAAVDHGSVPEKDEPHVFTIGSAVNVQPDSDVVIPINIEGPEYLAHGVRIEVFYDQTRLNVTSYTYGPVTTGKPSGSTAFCNISTPGYVSYAIICPTNPFSGLGNMINLNFHTAADFSGLAELDIQVREFYYYPIGGSQIKLPHVDVDGYISSGEVHSVDFVDWDGTLLKHQTVEHGGEATPPSDPTRPGYTFAGWEGDYTNVTEDRVITAQYEIGSYTVVFIDNFTGEDVILSEQTVLYNESAVAPEPPEHKGYTFRGWSRDFSHVSSDMTIYALYQETVYTVRFIDWDNTVLSEQQVRPGEQAVPPADPSRVGYNFVGWDDYSFLNVTRDLDIHAVYEVIKFCVTFYDWDGHTEITHQNVPYGQAATAPEPPVHTGHTFVGWDKDFSAVYSDLDVIALYDVAFYTVNFVDWDGTVLKSEQVEHGHDATPPSDPSREGYTFMGWDKDYHNITSALTINAQYEILTFTVTFLDKDGAAVIDEQTVDYGSAAAAPEPPVHTGFVFTGWDKDFSCVTSDLTVTALYEVQTFTVTFLDMDGVTVIDEQTVNYGEDAEAPEAPEHEGHVFRGWDKPFTNVTSDLTVTALYDRLQYTVIFLDRDGETELGRDIVYYGDPASAPEVPVYEGFVFAGWDQDITCVTHDMTVTAVYVVETFTVCFYDMDHTTLIDMQMVEYMQDAVPPEPPVHEGYTFREWVGDYTCVLSDLDIFAEYDINYYTVTFVDMDGETVLSTQTVPYGSAATAPEPPVHENLVFTGWDKDFSFVSCDMTVTALYSPSMLTVRFVDPYGELIDEQQVPYGEAATAPEPPEIPLRVFVGWDKDFSCVTEDMTVTAEYWLRGDVNNDGVIDTEDALRILRTALEITTFNETEFIVGDFNGDGVIDTEDALRVLRIALGIE